MQKEAEDRPVWPPSVYHVQMPAYFAQRAARQSLGSGKARRRCALVDAGRGDSQRGRGEARNVHQQRAIHAASRIDAQSRR